MTKEEQDLLDAALNCEHLRESRLALMVSRVSQETKDAIVNASKLAATALNFRTSFFQKALEECGLKNTTRNNDTYDFLVALAGKDLANLSMTP